MSFDLDDYNDVPSRIADFRTKHPEGSLQLVDVQFLEFAGKSWVVYRGAAFRTPDDVRPGHGTAWEPVPGKTPYTRDSELQNAETSAWGRAIVAALAADTRKGIASAEDVRNRRETEDASRAERLDKQDPSLLRAMIANLGKDIQMDPAMIAADFTDWTQGDSIATCDSATVLKNYLKHLEKLASETSLERPLGDTVA